MPKSFLLYPLLLLFWNCHNKKNEVTKPISIIANDYGGFTADPIEERFTLPYPSNLELDSNSLLFYRTNSFDTSILIHFFKKNDAIKVVCYEMLPTYHRFINDYADTANHLLFFEGYSFIINSEKWKSVKILAQELLADSNTQFKNERCADCGFGMISHNFKIRRTDKKNETLYDSYERWIKDSILKPFVDKRKPILFKKNG